jgi:hypothetical protein
MLYLRYVSMCLMCVVLMKDCFHDPKSIPLRRSELGLFLWYGARVNWFGSNDTMMMKFLYNRARCHLATAHGAIFCQ